MTTIKIISNPYQKKIGYQIWQESSSQWKDINYENNSNSKLLSSKMISSFFPFKVKTIIDTIIEEYHKPIKIVFEGTEDEYKELQDICKEESYQEITLTKSNRQLANARDILPDINELFDEKLRPLIMKSVNDYEKVRTEIDKYADASNDIIPICVLGNYSTGKSTFINALIGSEILPSGDEPVTAKIYKIKQSAFEDRAYIFFRYNEEPIKLKFKGGEIPFEFSKGTSENPLTSKLLAELSFIKDGTITFLVNKALEIINNFDFTEDGDKVSDLIEIEVPFVSGLWGESKNKFVIFDTPGSNSASNNKHLLVLKEAMSGFSNGLPIFVSEFDKLDSTDNEDLYREIENIKELDNRFTMIVVNKADAAELDRGGFSKEKELRILGETVPRNLYSGGLFFVSAVIGLGSKNNGDFIDDHYAELYEEKKTKFEDPTSRFYKRLYIYNIMPEQLKSRFTDMASKNPNLLFTNSGLFSVEKEIQTFAGKYSSYNKCQQAQLFLSKVIDTTFQEIENAIAEREQSKKNRDEHLKRDEKELIDKLENTSAESQTIYCEEYADIMNNLDDKADAVFTTEQLQSQESAIEKAKQSDNSYEERKSDVNNSVSKLWGGLMEDIKNVFTSFSFDSIKAVGDNFSASAGELVKNREELSNIEKKIDKETAEKLLNDVTEEFNHKFIEVKTMLDENSKNYWSDKAEQFKRHLVEIVTGASVLNNEKRMEIENIILTYGDIDFENNADTIFLRKDFRKGIRIGDWSIYETDKVDIDKLTRRYNDEMKNKIADARVKIQDSHTDSFAKWKENLVGTITTKIVDYSPFLHSQAQIIKEETEKILELEAKKKQLSDYTQEIKSMMDWKEL
ncbi:MAG: dynamin family protein [Clostridia bacterium]|nr:dynamin family protein [Clostridia bacterium]